MKEQVGQLEQISQLVAGIKKFLQLNFRGKRNLVSKPKPNLYLHSSLYIGYIE